MDNEKQLPELLFIVTFNFYILKHKKKKKIVLNIFFLIETFQLLFEINIYHIFHTKKQHCFHHWQ